MASRQLYVGTLGSLLVFFDGLVRSADALARQYEQVVDEHEGLKDVPVYRPEPWPEDGVEEATLVLIDQIFARFAERPALGPLDSQKRTYKALLKRAEPFRA